jgi:hypothetical protein
LYLVRLAHQQPVLPLQELDIRLCLALDQKAEIIENMATHGVRQFCVLVELLDRAQAPDHQRIASHELNCGDLGS